MVDLEVLKRAKDVCCEAHRYEEAAAIRDAIAEISDLRAIAARHRERRGDEDRRGTNRREVEGG